MTPTHLLSLLVALSLTLSGLAACDRDKEDSAAEESTQEEPESAERLQGSAPAGGGAVPEEFRPDYVSELERARQWNLALPARDDRALEGTGNRELSAVVAEFATVEADPLERDFFEALSSGGELPEVAVELVDRHEENIAELRDVLGHTSYAPRLNRSGEPTDNGPDQPTYAAARLMAAWAAQAPPETCLERSADGLRLAFASSYGMGYLGGYKQNALAQWAIAAATGCMNKASEQVREEAAARFAALERARPALVEPTYFEWLVQIPRVSPIASGDSQDPELSSEDARQAIAQRMGQFDELRELAKTTSYTDKNDRLEALIGGEEDGDNLVYEMDRKLYDALLEKDRVLQEELEKLADM